MLLLQIRTLASPRGASEGETCNVSHEQEFRCHSNISRGKLSQSFHHYSGKGFLDQISLATTALYLHTFGLSICLLEKCLRKVPRRQGHV